MPVTPAAKEWNKVLIVKLKKHNNGNLSPWGIRDTSLTFGEGVRGGGDSIVSPIATGAIAAEALGLRDFFGLTSVLNWSSGRRARKGTWEDMNGVVVSSCRLTR